MIRRPPRSTRTDTLFPYTTLFRSPCGMPVVIRIAVSLVVTRRSSTYRLVRAAPYRQSRYARSEEHTSELQSLMRISYAVFCLKKKKHKVSTPPSTKHSAQTSTQRNANIRHTQPTHKPYSCSE